MEQAQEGKEIATLAGGCFWCLEAVYDRLQGVESVESGYTGGERPNPTYEAVCSGRRHRLRFQWAKEYIRAAICSPAFLRKRSVGSSTGVSIDR